MLAFWDCYSLCRLGSQTHTDWYMCYNKHRRFRDLAVNLPQLVPLNVKNIIQAWWITLISHDQHPKRSIEPQETEWPLVMKILSHVKEKTPPGKTA